MSNNTTAFRLLKVPKLAKRTLAAMCERKNEELMKEISELKEEWIVFVEAILKLNKELRRVKTEYNEYKKRDEYYTRPSHSKVVSRSEEADFEALWTCYGGP